MIVVFPDHSHLLLCTCLICFRTFTVDNLTTCCPNPLSSTHSSRGGPTHISVVESIAKQIDLPNIVFKSHHKWSLKCTVLIYPVSTIRLATPLSHGAFSSSSSSVLMSECLYFCFSFLAAKPATLDLHLLELMFLIFKNTAI